MGLAAWLRLATTLLSLIDKATDAYKDYKERERGRLELMLELRQKRDQEKVKANEIDSKPIPPLPDADLLDRL